MGHNMNMTNFESYRSYRQFAVSITKRWRYARDPEQAVFLKAVVASSVARQEVIAAGSKLWRAQLGHVWRKEDLGGGVVEDLPEPFDVERMKPLRDCAREGRANPKGIPFLYLSTCQKTAVAEVRPWIGSYVSIAQFTLNHGVRVVNCVTDDHRIMMYFGEPEPEERERAVWKDIERAFSQPVTSGDDTADYAPTQVIAEFFRENGLDGIAYGSSLGEGHNIALFDTEAVAPVKCGLVEIRRVELDSSPVGNPYFAADASPQGSASGA
jgi:hypothetical protein